MDDILFIHYLDKWDIWIVLAMTTFHFLNHKNDDIRKSGGLMPSIKSNTSEIGTSTTFALKYKQPSMGNRKVITV